MEHLKPLLMQGVVVEHLMRHIRQPYVVVLVPNLATDLLLLVEESLVETIETDNHQQAAVIREKLIV